MARVVIHCPNCGRSRNVAQRSRAGIMSSGEQTPNAQLGQWCPTCKMLLAIQRHQAAIDELSRRVAARRVRGL